jgi:hypothetical protein
MLELVEILLVLAFFAAVLIAALRFYFVPVWKRKKNIISQTYCPSILLSEMPEKFNRIMDIPSHKQSKVYRVNLFLQTCTCKRFRSSRGFYPNQDIRRLCRHQRKEIANSLSSLSINELQQCIIEKRVRDKCYEEIEIKKTPVAIGFHPRSDFVRVYSRKQSPADPPDGPLTGEYDKFTLVLSQESWVYGTPPPGAEEIISATGEMLKKYRAIRKDKKKSFRFKILP